MITHRDEAYRIIGIGCEPCEDGEMHTMCDFKKPIQSHDKAEKMEIKPLEYKKERKCESKDFFHCDKFEIKTKKTPYIKIS